MLEVKNLVKRYGNFSVLKGISFFVEKGSVLGFLGPNGAGKSTTMNILTGMIDFQEGQIIFDGLDLKKEKESIRRKVGYLPENPVYYSYMNADEYLQMIGQISQFPADKLTSRISELLDLVDLKKARKRRIGGYSRGMKQRLGLAVALFNDPEYLFLDEPTSALDPEGRADMINLMEDLRTMKIIVFLSTHILADVERVCDRVSILHNGEIKLTEKMEDLQGFIQPIFDIELEGQVDSLKEELSKSIWIEQVVADESTLTVFVKDLERGKRELPVMIGRSGASLVSYRIRQTTLEDIFIRMVRDNENI